MKPIPAVHEIVVFRPTAPVEPPDGILVTVEPLGLTEPALPSSRLERIHALLSHAEDTGDAQLAERHDQHQP